MRTDIDRRDFIGATAATGAFTLVPRHVLGGAGYVPPSDKVTLAHIGMGTQGFRELGSLLEAPEIQIVAVCDPNKDSEDYIEWRKGSVREGIQKLLGNPNWRAKGRGCPGGREVGREVIDAYYAGQRGAENFRGCASYADFRELLDKERDLDAVKIMTPDHLHATISLAAMKKGCHVVMHKPIANRMHEARLVIDAARQANVTTHLLAYGSGYGNAMIARKIRQGAIGALREIHNWSNRPVWPQYPVIPADRQRVPKGFDWDLWLGPATDRPYHPHYTHTVFRGWYDFGGGSIADMGIYSLWPVLEELGLGTPVSADPWASHACAIIDHASRPIKNDYSFPYACRLRFQFPPQDGKPAPELFWYDGGMRPRLPKEWEAENREMGIEGILFTGEEGAIVADFHGNDARLYTKRGGEPLWGPAEQTGVDAQRRQPRTAVWLQAILKGEQSPGSFRNAGPISDMCNLGAVALRAGKKVLFDSERMEITNLPEASQYLRREYRPGWEL